MGWHERGQEGGVGVYAVAERATEVERLKHRVGVAESRKRIAGSEQAGEDGSDKPRAMRPGARRWYAPRVAELRETESGREVKEGTSAMLVGELDNSTRT